METHTSKCTNLRVCELFLYFAVCIIGMKLERASLVYKILYHILNSVLCRACELSHNCVFLHNNLIVKSMMIALGGIIINQISTCGHNKSKRNNTKEHSGNNLRYISPYK